MKIIICFILVCFLFPSSNIKQNGEDWESWSFTKKVGYVEGFFDGFDTYELLLSKTIKMEKKRDPYWLPPLIITILNKNSENYIDSVKKYDSIEFSKRLDGFYHEPDNYGIFIMDAIKILNLRQLGNGKAADIYLIECQKKYLKDK